jgi:hypothetical protein
VKILYLSVILLFILTAGLFLYTWYRLHVKVNLHSANSQRDLPEGWEATTQYVTNKEGQKIAYWYFPVNESKATIILIHGYNNPGGKPQMLGHAEYLHDAGYSTVLLDLRAYGESDGNKQTLTVNEWKDAEAVYDKIKSLEENRNKTVGLFGVSMGGATAIMTAGKTGKGDFVIASVPYANFDSLFHFQIKAAGFPPSIIYPIMRVAGIIELGSDFEQFTPSAVIKNVKVPIFLISAKQDEELDGNDAKLLYELANQPKELWEVNSKHDVFHEHPGEFKQRMRTFLQKYAE